MPLVLDFKEREGLHYVWVYGGDRCAAYCCQNHISLLWFAVAYCVLLYMCCFLGVVNIGQNYISLLWFAVPCCVLLYMCCCFGVLYIGQNNIDPPCFAAQSELRYFVLLYLYINKYTLGRNNTALLCFMVLCGAWRYPVLLWCALHLHCCAVSTWCRLHTVLVKTTSHNSALRPLML